MANCCEGVRVWHTEELDFCCPHWDGVCKDPSGFYMALVMYTPDGEKEYATTSGTIDSYFVFSYPDGTPLDESAFSVSLDDAVSFNQIGLIDTDIDRISDVAVCPDCSVIYISTINEEYSEGGGDYPSISDEFTDGVCNCDSVWRSYDDGAIWERVYHGDWVDDSGRHSDELILRLPCDMTEECCTLYLGVKDQDSDGPGSKVAELDQIYYTRDCGQCWNNPPATKVDIQDIAIESENIVYVLDTAGMVSKSTIRPPLERRR